MYVQISAQEYHKYEGWTLRTDLRTIPLMSKQNSLNKDQYQSGQTVFAKVGFYCTKCLCPASLVYTSKLALSIKE